jgi:hypothetical protein
MSKQGFYAAQEGHIVNILAPVNISGGVTAQCFHLKQHSHASIVVQLGVQAAAATKILLNACSSAAGAGATAIPYDLYTQETAGVVNDVTSTRNAITAAGYTPSGNAGIFYILEVDASNLPAGLPYLQLQITNGANADFASAVAILSGGRNTGDQSPTVTT